jgi:hypothetical protein
LPYRALAGIFNPNQDIRIPEYQAMDIRLSEYQEAVHSPRDSLRRTPDGGNQDVRRPGKIYLISYYSDIHYLMS